MARLQRLAQRWLLEPRSRARSILIWMAPAAPGLCIGILGPMLLLHIGVFASMDGGLTNLGFDAERVLLIDRAACALLGGAIAAGLSGRRVAGAAGGLLFYIVGYLLPFAQQVAHPGVSPTGQREEVIAGAYQGMLVALCVLGIAAAGTGAVIGGAIAEITLAPMRALCVAWVRYFCQSAPRPATRAFIRPALALAAGVGLAALIIASADTVSYALTYGPTTGIYRPMWPSASTRSTPASVGLAHRERAHGTLEQGSYVSPALGGMRRTYYVYLPPSYSTTLSRRYPTVYLLHGSPGGPLDWMGAGEAPLTVDSLVATGNMREVILVAADGRGPVYPDSEWANSADGRQRMEDAVAKDLVGYIDRRYRTLPDAADRVIGGLSEGGYGAVNLTLHHPDVFGAAISEGGYFTAAGPVFGSGPPSASTQANNSPLWYISTPAGKQALSRVRFVIGDGTDDGQFYTDAMMFVRQLDLAHAKVTVITVPGGHSWRNWADIFAQAIQAIERPHGTGASHT